MAPKTYAELKKQVADMKKAEDALKAEIARLTAVGTDAAAALAAKEAAEAEVETLKGQIEQLTAGMEGAENPVIDVAARVAAQAEIDSLKKQIDQLTAEIGKDVGTDAAAALAAKEAAEAEASELQTQIDELTAQIAQLTAEAPPSIWLDRPYAFYDDDGIFMSWEIGKVEDADHIEILRERGVI